MIHFKPSLIIVVSLIFLGACTKVTSPSHVAGHWECDKYELDLTEDGQYSLYSTTSKDSYKGTFTLKSNSKDDMTEIVATPSVYPISDYNLMKSKPLQEKLTSMNGLMLYKRHGGEFMQCRASRK